MPKIVHAPHDERWILWHRSASPADMSFALPKNDPALDADANLRQGGQMACDVANGTARLLGEEATVQAFHLYSDGWGLPELLQRGAAKGGLDAMVKDMMHKRRL